MRNVLQKRSLPLRPPISGRKLHRKQGSDLIMPPPDKDVPHQAGLLLVPGPNVSSKAYRPVLSAIQHAARAQGMALYAGCVHYAGPTSNPRHPQDLNQSLTNIIDALRIEGLDPEAPQFHAAHALNTIFLQDYLKMGRYTAGQILFGGLLLRKHWYPTFSYGVPTLTVCAEFDGEMPFLRQAEQYRVHREIDQDKFPMVVLEGQTNMQFAKGLPQIGLHQQLEPAVGEKAAHAAIADVAVDFMRKRLGLEGAGKSLRRRLSETEAKFLPTMLMQESIYLNDSGPRGLGPASF